MRLMILGKDGQVGWELQRALAPLGDVIALGRAEADLSDAQSLAVALARYAPGLIVNAAAHTAVDRAEDEPGLARRVNTDAVAELAAYAVRTGAGLIHYSTDYVFDGQKPGPYRESDPVNPLSVYGRTKADGEAAILVSGCRGIILRTSWVHSGHGRNFARAILERAGRGERLRVVSDQIGAPTGAPLIADVTAHVGRSLLAGSAALGVFHLAAAGQTTWFDYARTVVEIAQSHGVAAGFTIDQIEPVAAVEYSVKAKRPQNSMLDTTALCTAFGLVMPGWRDGVVRTVRELTWKHS